MDAEQLTVPLTIFIVLAEDPYGSARSKENAINLVKNASRIWDQAGIVLDIKNMYEIERTEEEMRIFYSTPHEFFGDTNRYDPATINSFLVGNLNGINGLAFGGARSIAVADYTTVYDFRAFAHEIGHILGLNHVSGSRGQLMYRGANGFGLSLGEIERARILAQEFIGDGLVSIAIKDTEINIELADTAEKKSQGLSGRNGLPQNQGMLFVYDTPAFYSFWMKDMQFSIDIIWIDEDYKIIDITKGVSPDSFPQSFQPQKPAQYVLEVNAGFGEKNNIKIGDTVERLQLLRAPKG